MPQPIHLKDHEKDARLVRRRVIVGAVAVVLLTLVLVARMYHLQVTQYEVPLDAVGEQPGPCAADPADPRDHLRPQRRDHRRQPAELQPDHHPRTHRGPAEDPRHAGGDPRL
ncbi:hypothetical protein ACPA9J_34350 [Pseudomonas aeruginosa]